MVETENGDEIMVHIGIDTVQYQGKGFFVLKEQGSQVKAGEEVISFEKKPRFTESDTSSAELNNIFCRLITEYKDRLVEELWCEFEDVLMVEARAYYKNDPDYSNDISLVSGSSWQGFPAALPVEKFWEWFNNHYSNGIDCLRS